MEGQNKVTKSHSCNFCNRRDGTNLKLRANCGGFCFPMRVEDKFARSVMCSETNSVFEGGQTHEVLFGERKKQKQK